MFYVLQINLHKNTVLKIEDKLKQIFHVQDITTQTNYFNKI